MRYSDDIIEEVRSRNDIVDVIGGYVALNQRGNSISACCPFHHEKTPSFHVSREKQIYHCFGCGVGGNVFTFIMEYENYSFPEAIKLLAERGGVELPEIQMSEEDKSKENYKVMLKEMNKTAAAYFHYLLTKTDHGAKAREYLAKRGYTEETINRFGMGYADIYQDDLYKYLKNKGYTDAQMAKSGLVDISEAKGGTDKFWNRVMVPILDINGKVIAFGGRVLGDGKPKYINTQETAVFEKNRNLFALNIAKRSKRRGIIICEGYMDVIAMHQAGFDNAVASLGTAFTIGQATLLKRYTDEVYLAYDSDGAGTSANLKAIDILREVGITTRVINMAPCKDPDEFILTNGVDAFEERISNAITGIVFEVDVISRDYRLDDPEDKIKFIKNVALRLSKIDEPVVRHSYIEAIAKKYDVDKDDLKRMVTAYGTATSASKSSTNTYGTSGQNATTRTVSEKSKAEDYKPQSLLLSWMVGMPELFDTLKDVITEDDFTDEDYKTIAHMLFEQYKNTGKVSAAAIVNVFDDVEKQHLVAEILQTELPFDTTIEEKEKALNDVVIKTKQQRIDYEAGNCAGDLSKIQQLIGMKTQLAGLHISLKNG